MDYLAWSNNYISFISRALYIYLIVPRSDDSDDEVSLRQLNNDTETNVDQRVEGRISYYSYENFESRNSELKKVNLDLQAPSKISSQYESMTDVSRSFMLAAWNE